MQTHTPHTLTLIGCNVFSSRHKCDDGDGEYLDRLRFKRIALVKDAAGALRTEQPTSHSFLI